MKKKSKIITVVLFILGLILYIMGLFFLLGFGIKDSFLAKYFFVDGGITDTLALRFKVAGLILFLIGFLIFMIAIISLYKNDTIKDDNINLIVEGKADIITLIIMTYVMIFMIVICLIYNQLLGALLFGIAIVLQCIVNWSLIKYYSNAYHKK